MSRRPGGSVKQKMAVAILSTKSARARSGTIVSTTKMENK
jgi:hypothetical protein